MTAKRTLYVHRPLLNGDELASWAKSIGFSSVLQSSDFHVTIAFSRAKVAWNRMSPWKSRLRIRTKHREIVPLGDKGAIVLKFKSLILSERWNDFCQIGCSWDWDGYHPHITITYDGDINDIDTAYPYPGELIFGPEMWSEVIEDWEDNIVEQHVA